MEIVYFWKFASILLLEHGCGGQWGKRFCRSRWRAHAVVTLTESRSGSDAALDVGWLALTMFGIPWDKQKMPMTIAEAKAAGPVSVPFNRLPLVVTFEDLRDPLLLRNGLAAEEREAGARGMREIPCG